MARHGEHHSGTRRPGRGISGMQGHDIRAQISGRQTPG
jgi:hypothetical protein